jgi:hypothetical protein
MAEVSFGYFPDYDVQWDIQIRRAYKTLIWTSLTGKEIRRRLYPIRESTGTGHKGGYGYLSVSSTAYTPAQREVVANFLDSVDGAFRAFYVFRRDFDNFSNYYVGDVTSQSSIVIPFKEAEVTSVTVANVSKAFTINHNVGPGGESRINFTAGDQTGAVRITAYARERWLVRALNDEVIETFIANVVKDNTVIPLAFKQVR